MPDRLVKPCKLLIQKLTIPIIKQLKNYKHFAHISNNLCCWNKSCPNQLDKDVHNSAKNKKTKEKKKNKDIKGP